MKRALYLAELLLGKGYEVYGLVRVQNNPKVEVVRQIAPMVDSDRQELA